ncbi:hypothetical protein [Bacillus tuaregi]|uniref:hypothetical protein n=1 Tax=Bacillus tuaregi TaxID=1816695 RepID=UPI0008F91FA2|nr:hypothetical protein [Bacillus tuaregi]
MNIKLIDQLILNLEKLKIDLGEKKAKRLSMTRLDRIIKRLVSFEDCQECQNHLSEMNTNLEYLKSKHGRLEKQDIREHQRLVNQVISHLQKKHKLITEGFYVGTYMIFGLALGYAIGFFIFNDYIMGSSIGLLFGVILGSSMDANAKKKGLTI